MLISSSEKSNITKTAAKKTNKRDYDLDDLFDSDDMVNSFTKSMLKKDE